MFFCHPGHLIPIDVLIRAATLEMQGTVLLLSENRVKFSVSDPNPEPDPGGSGYKLPAWIRIRIHIRNPDPDPGS